LTTAGQLNGSQAVAVRGLSGQLITFRLDHSVDFESEYLKVTYRDRLRILLIMWDTARVQ